MDPKDPDSSRPRPRPPAPRGAFARWISPGADSSWAALRVNTAVWTALGAAWILYLGLADMSSYRLVLYPLLVLVALVQVLTNIASMRKKRGVPPPAP